MQSIMSTFTHAPFEFLPLGAVIQTFRVGGVNIVQAFPKQEQYEAHNAPYFGETIGRVANRISNAKINSLNGKSYQLAVNNGPNTLHGGVKGWGKRIWDGPHAVGVKQIPGLSGSFEGGESVVFRLKSEDGDEGYPGTVEATVTYTAGTEKSPEGKTVNVLGIEYQAELVDGAEETVANITNHSYFNLTGAPSIEGTEVSLSTNLYLPVHYAPSGGIPTGEVTPYPGIAANQTFTLGPTEPDIDDCFVFPDDPSSIPIDTRSSPLRKLVSAYHPSNGNHLEVHATDPAFQFYTGKFIDVPAVEGVAARGPRSGFCVEASRFVNAPNVEAWKGQVLLKRGEMYGSRMVYKGWCDKE